MGMMIFTLLLFLFQINSAEPISTAKEAAKRGEQYVLTARDFLLANYKNVAICTDLEPDDVLALKIIFDAANQNYREGKTFPIKLIVVGEGNSSIKRLRMEKLLKEYFNLPKDIQVPVVEGRSTKDNQFIYDGYELFDSKELEKVPYKENTGEKGAAALKAFIEGSENPLLLQLKPAQELLTLSQDGSLSRKTTVVFYGGFNLRKTVQDDEVLKNRLFDQVREKGISDSLQKLIDHFSHQFSKIAIAGTYAMLGEDSSVYYKNPWSHPIIEEINASSTPFSNMFRTLVSNWNRYLFMKTLQESEETITKMDQHLSATNATTLIKSDLDQLKEDVVFMQLLQPSSGLQFTLADVLVALAITQDSPLIKGTPSQIHIDEKGHLQAFEDPKSNLLFYDKVDKKELVTLLIQLFQKNKLSWMPAK